ncbi:MAG: hypothetical protein IJ597_05225, partial [Synergistaceae bacterium]|nr:hypothetical protein [Synergistaceae bacterium]
TRQANKDTKQLAIYNLNFYMQGIYMVQSLRTLNKNTNGNIFWLFHMINSSKGKDLGYIPTANITTTPASAYPVAQVY